MRVVVQLRIRQTFEAKGAMRRFFPWKDMDQSPWPKGKYDTGRVTRGLKIMMM